MLKPDPELFLPRIQALLARAQKQEKGLLPEYDRLVGDYAEARGEGWEDPHREISDHLQNLKAWIRHAELTSTP